MAVHMLSNLAGGRDILGSDFAGEAVFLKTERK